MYLTSGSTFSIFSGSIGDHALNKNEVKLNEYSKNKKFLKLKFY